MKISLLAEAATHNLEVICMASDGTSTILDDTMVSTSGGEFTYTLSDDTCAGPQMKVQWTSDSADFGPVVYFIEFQQSCA